ncbi:Peptidyl-prolyl cis-trans isomerase [hydrothermal vent metagenome]|uniref:peptidylprolyl isomerase n=1 Tax=hydrothermal vent metagenome TaxID=652676 RepID=A0A3B0S4K6_9ZZZZ
MKSWIWAVGFCLLAFSATAEDAPAPTPWRTIAPENLLLIDTDYGRTVIELNPEFAPNHVQRIRDLSKVNFYDGLTFYRVIEGFVAQGGRGEGDGARALPEGYGTLRNENDKASEGLAFAPLGSPDLYAPESGHVNGFAAAQNPKTGRTWLQHCPGIMAMARSEDPDTGDAEFYIVLGPGTRYLDRNLTVFGRVIDGMQFIQKLNRGVRAVESGVIQDAAKRDIIRSFKIAADVPEIERPTYQVMPTPSDEFEIHKTKKRIRSEAFFYRHPPEVVEACTVVAPARLVE